jgi:hypothetical protein
VDFNRELRSAAVILNKCVTHGLTLLVEQELEFVYLVLCRCLQFDRQIKQKKIDLHYN